MNPLYEANPCICPNNPSQLWRLSCLVYHVIDAPDTIPPLDLATRLIQECNHSQPTTADDLRTDLTFNQTIRLLHNQGITITMIAELQPNNIALFNSKIAAQDRFSDHFHPTKQTKGVLQTTTTTTLQDKIPAHPTQQILFATTVEDSATMLLDA